MIIDGPFATEMIDSSGEIIRIKGIDTSSVDDANDAVCNWEHQGEEAGPSAVVGKILRVKKIFKREDCEDDRQRMYWDELKKPMLYGVARLFNTAGHAQAMALAAIIRDCHHHGEPIVAKFSIEGSTLKREGNELLSTCMRAVAITIKPCNKTATSGLISDPMAPEGFDKKPVKDKGILDTILDKFSKTETTINPFVAENLTKSLSAGMPTGAPSTLTGGAALQKENLKRKLVEIAKSFDSDKHGDAKTFLKTCMPEVADEFIDKFSDMVNEFKVKAKDLKKMALPVEQPNLDVFNKASVFKTEALTVDILAAIPQLKSLRKADGTLPAPKSTIIDADIHGLKHLNLSPEQTKMIHGLDTSKYMNRPVKPLAPGAEGINAMNSTWINHPDGPVYIKTHKNLLPGQSGFAESHKEAVYHNLAHQFFNMGQYVPTTAAFRHPNPPQQHANKVWSAQRMVPGAEHFDYQNPEHNKVLDHLQNSGEIDKMRIMNSVLGNDDRHEGNFVMTPHGPGIGLIDHGLAFGEYGEMQAPAYCPPHDPEHLHPATASWLASLDPNELAGQMHSQGVPSPYVEASTAKLTQFQNRLRNSVPVNGLHPYSNIFGRAK